MGRVQPEQTEDTFFVGLIFHRGESCHSQIEVINPFFRGGGSWKKDLCLFHDSTAIWYLRRYKILCPQWWICILLPAFIHPNGMGLKNENRDWKNPEDAMKRNVGDLLWISCSRVKSGLFVWKFCHFEEGASLQDEMEREVNDSKARNQISSTDLGWSTAM